MPRATILLSLVVLWCHSVWAESHTRQLLDHGSGRRLMKRAEHGEHHKTHGTHGAGHTNDFAFNTSKVAEVDPNSLCIKDSVLRIEDPAASKYGSMRGWMAQPDWVVEMDKIDSRVSKTCRIGIDGYPCAAYGCCQHSLLIRTYGSDRLVVERAINEYARFLKSLLPWRPKTILEGGGNIGVATSLFAFMYPDAKLRMVFSLQIVVLEPEPENCELLKENNRKHDNVFVECIGLWGKADTSVRLYSGGDGSAWGWRLEEVPPGTSESVSTTSVPALLKKYNIDGFDMAKIDIEGAEFSVFEHGADTQWLKHVQLAMLEVHWPYGNGNEILNTFKEEGFEHDSSGEYDTFTRPVVLEAARRA